MKMFAGLVPILVIGTVLAVVGPPSSSSSKPKVSIPKPCAAAIFAAGDAFVETDQIFGDPNDPNAPPEQSLFADLVTDVEAGGTGAAAAGEIVARLHKFSAAEASFFTHWEECKARVRNVQAP